MSDREGISSVKLWFRIDSKDSSKNILRVLSPRPFSPFPIPFDDFISLINEEDGTIEFRIVQVGNLFDKKLRRIWVFDLPIGSSRLLLIREGYFKLLFYHFSPKLGFRVASLDVSQLSNAKGLHVFVTWSGRESCLYIGDMEGKVGLLSARAENRAFHAISGKDGSFLLVGDEGVDVKMVYIKKGEKTVAEPNAIDTFNFGIERLNTLISGCTSGDFLFETTCVQAGLVMLIGALEAYFRKRLLEMEIEGWSLDFDSLCEEIFPRRYLDSNKREIEERAKAEGRRKLEVLVGDRKYAHRINFLDFDIFNKGYGIKIGEIPGIKPQIIEQIRRLILFRHKIVHSGRDMTVLNDEDLPSKTPIFSNKQLLEDARDIFVEFVGKLHKATSK